VNRPDINRIPRRERIGALQEYINHMERRHAEHLRLIRLLSMESISPDEAEELQEQIAALIAEVGTCRGHIRELLQMLEGACAERLRGHLQERLEEIRRELER
jgi:hypothetical protein